MAAAPAVAKDGAVFAGLQADQGEGAFVGATISPGGLGRGWALRGSASASRFRYLRDSTSIDGRYAGAQLLLVRQWSGSWGWANLAAGPRVASIRLDPADPQNRRAGSEWDVVFAADGARRWGRLRSEVYGAYGADQRDYQVRADLTHDLPRSPWRAGLEMGASGDPAYDRRLVGVVFGRDLSAGLLRMSVGVSDQTGRSSRGYGAVALVRTF